MRFLLVKSQADATGVMLRKDGIRCYLTQTLQRRDNGTMKDLTFKGNNAVVIHVSLFGMFTLALIIANVQASYIIQTYDALAFFPTRLYIVSNITESKVQQQDSSVLVQTPI